MPLVSPRVRLGVSWLVGLAVAAVAWLLGPWQVALLAGWGTWLLVFVAWVWSSIGRLDAEATRRVATTEDLSHVLAELLWIAASLMNLLAVGMALVMASDERRGVAALINAAAVVSVVASWAAVHTVFALRYARMYYERGEGLRLEGGPPDYRDFAYVAFTIGMTYQVSDTDTTSPQFRRTMLGHALLSYLFGTVIIATVINAVVGLFRA
jgi:uncharacterized membrane protein